MEKVVVSYDSIKESLKKLLPGEVMLTCIRNSETDPNKVIFEFVEKYSAKLNLTALGNATDERFNNGGLLYAWQSYEKAVLESLFGIKLSELTTETITTKGGNEVEVYVVGIKNPHAAGYPVRLRIQESNAPFNEWQAENVEKAIRQDGNGNYLVANGQPIFRRVTPEIGTFSHTLVEHDSMVESIDEFEFIAPFTRVSSSVKQEIEA